MEYFAMLIIGTVVILALQAGLYRRRRDMGLVVGVGALYYWSLYGAWFIVVDKLGGVSGQHYYYLEYKLFPIALDGDYMITLGLYVIFIVTIQATILLMLPRRRRPPFRRMVLRHEPILILGLLAGIGSYFVIRDKLSTAWALNTSAYIYTRTQTGQWFTLHQVLNRVALIPAAIGVATLAAGDRSRFFVNVTRPYTWPGYVLLLGGMGAFTFVLGNKNEVFMALLTGTLAYAGSMRRPNWRKLALAVAAGLWLLTAIDFFRGTPISRIGDALVERYDESTDIGHFVASSNEAFAAHFSMYGVLAARVEPRFGYSIYSLICSVIPRVLWPERPRDIYFYYSESVGAIQNQGYSLHHATGWYLNFGYVGVFIGAVVLGLLWVSTLNAERRITAKSGLLFRLMAATGPWLFAAGLPPLIRAGPEGYKGFVLECLLIPLTVLVLACRPQKARKKKLTWSAQNGWTVEGRRPRVGLQAAL